MKKIFLCALAAAALTTACNKAEVIDVVGTPAIQFENAFVNNATRAAVDPSYNNANMFSQFYVWGYMDNAAGIVFNQEPVSKTGSDWTYSNTQYWLPNHNYTFEAVTATDYAAATVKVSNPGEVDVVSVDFVNEDGTNDLLYSTATATTTGVNDLSTMGKVGLTFNHLLSKVKFTFTNDFDNENTTIVVTDIAMTAPKQANVTVADKAWTALAESTTLQFGHVDQGRNIPMGEDLESDHERLTIPAGEDQEYVVTFKVQLYNGTVPAFEPVRELTTTIKGITLEVGKAYNFQAKINASNILGPDEKLYPIEFNVVEITDWDDVENVPTNLDGVSVEAGKSFTLVGDATAVNTVNVAGSFDGAGNTIAVENPSADFVSDKMFKFIELNGADVTLKNVTVDGQDAVSGEYGVRNIVITGAGKYLVDNVQSINATYPLHVSTTADVQLTVVNSTMEGWLSYNAGTTATFENVAFTTKTYGRFRPYGTTTLTNCSFDAGYVIDLSHLAAGETVTFVNCTYKGAALTATNVTTVDGEKNMAGTYEIK